MAASTMLSTRGILDKKAGSKNGKSAGSKRPAQPPIKCPECSSTKTWKDGLRYINLGPVQRYICRNCAYRFSDPDFQHAFNGSDMSEHVQNVLTKKLKRHADLPNPRQVCVALTEGAKNLAISGARQEKPMREGTKLDKADVKGKILEFTWKLKRDGYSNTTIEHYGKFLKSLLKKGADLMNPESVKDVIATQDQWGNNTKCLVVAAYHSFTSFNEIHWKPPKYKPTRKLPFIPLEKEIDALIVYCGKKTATRLQLLKETGMRIGEALKLKWIDVDLERKIITLNNPEKHGNPRAFKISDKLVAMLNRLPKNNDKLFGKTSVAIAVSNFYNQRKRAVAKLQNPRLLRITFHTLRHWKATMEYQKTRDILHVMKLLGHKNIQNTLIYTHLVSYETDDYHSATADNVQEARKLIESGFEYICTTNDIMLFRKRK